MQECLVYHDVHVWSSTWLVFAMLAALFAKHNTVSGKQVVKNYL